MPPYTFTLPQPETARLPDPYRDEIPIVRELAASLSGAVEPSAVKTLATPWVMQVRENPAPFWAMESLLREYPITTSEGLALMRLAEALLRVPDTPTAIALTADQLGRADFGASEGDGPHRLWSSLSATAINLSKKFLPDGEAEGGVLQRLGAQTVVSATVRAIQLLGRQFVLGRNIGEAMREADRTRREQPRTHSALRFSYDMLGEGARTEADARRYLAAYSGAITAIADGRRADSPEAADGISIKLSALFSRYEALQRDRVAAELLPRVWQLVEQAAQANLNLTIDAEEVDRLELSLDVLDALAARIAQDYPQWRGFGLAVQAYQTRGRAVIDAVAGIARRHGLRFMVRLVKGAYWDGEIKRAQELGLAGYPVFTHKAHTDVSYLACAQALIGHADVIYPQFATHNAGTIAAIVLMARAAQVPFEMQRLHGMGEGIYREVLKDGSIPCRVYAPVGEHRDLLAYLVRRLLENGANSSFVHQLADASVPPADLLESPLRLTRTQGAFPLPAELYRAAGEPRLNSTGADLSVVADRQPFLQALAQTNVSFIPDASEAEVPDAMARLQAAQPAWQAQGVAHRAAVLRRAADLLDAERHAYCALLVKEAHKTLGDCIAEVREAVDFLRYYAMEAERHGDAVMHGRGVFVCISPWNFPLAIFAGQIAAALVAGNTVAAKPAEQTPAVAARMVALLHAAGVPADALVLLCGAGERVGAALVAHPATRGVCFTGSTAVAQIINRTLAEQEARPGEPPAVLIAETGGLNAMVVDTTALPEQVVDAVVQSAFRSAGQRCSALRLLCVQDGMADGLLDMLSGAVAELRVGDPANLATDVGPVIDEEAHAGIQAHIARLRQEARPICEGGIDDPNVPRLVRPLAVALAQVGDLHQEIFGPVLHVVRWRGDVDALLAQINALGYGLTLGVQTRIDSRAERLADAARIGNVYVNRNIIGAVVGVQPFGGEGLSGTGPKAGGPHYLLRFARCAEAPESALAEPLTLPREEGLSSSGEMARLIDGLAAHPELPALEERCVQLRRAADRLPAPMANAVRDAAAQAAAALVEQPLPGPTGERNTLRLHGRGVIAVLAHGATPAAVARAVALAWAAGNRVALAGASAQTGTALREALTAAGVPSTALALMDDTARAARALLQQAQLAGVCVAGGAAPLRAIHRILAERQGAILPLIGPDELNDARQLYRFAAEQTLTVNTAAAGGNASLLAGQG